MTTSTPHFRKISIGIGILIVAAAIGYGAYRRAPELVAWLRGTGTTSIDEKAPDLPAKPAEADDSEAVKLYAVALAKREARLNDPNYVAFMSEGLEWKSIGDYAKEDRNRYYLYAAYVYTEAGKAFPDQWVPWLNVGNMFNIVGEYGRAEQAFKKAIETDPSRHDAFTALVEMLYWRGITPTDDIVTYLTGAYGNITSDPSYSAFAYAKYLITHERYQDALDIFTAAKKAFPSGAARFDAEIDALQRLMRGESLDAPPAGGNPVIELN